MPGLSSPITTPAGMPVVNRSSVARAAGFKHLSRAEFDQAVVDERAAITSGAGLYQAGERLYIIGEEGYRLWVVGSDAASSHARTVILSNTTTRILTGDANQALATTGAPSSGTGSNGDQAVDRATGIVYLKSSGAWAQVAVDGGVSSGSTPIDFSTAIPFTADNADMGIKYIDGPLTFTVNTVGAARGKGATVTVVGNGSITPVFDLGFVSHGTNAGFNNGAGIVNTLTMWYDGLKYYYSWSQESAPVAVGVADLVGPQFVSAQVSNGVKNVIAISMNEPLVGTAPAAAAFTVSGGKTVSSVAIVGSMVNVTVSSAYAFGDSITVTYTKPGTNPLRDAAGNQTENFGPSSVTNNIGASDVTVPTVTAAAVANASPTVVNLTFSEAMDQTSLPAASAFTVGGHTVSSIAFVDATHLNITVSAAYVNGEAASTLAYTQPGANNLKDLAGNLLANFTALAITNNVSASDTVAPTVSSMEVAAANPAKIIVVFNEPLVTGVPATSAFTASGKTVTGVALNAGNLEITVDSAYTANATPTLGYTQPASNRLQDAAGNFVATLSPRYISNNILGGADPAVSLINTSGVSSSGAAYFGSVGSAYIADQWGVANKSFPAGNTVAEVHGHLSGYVTGEAIPIISLDTVGSPDIFANTLLSIASNGAGNYNIKENGVGVTGNVVASRAIQPGDKYGTYRDASGNYIARVSSDGGATWTTLHNYTTVTTTQLFILLQMTNTCGISNIRGAGLV